MLKYLILIILAVGFFSCGNDKSKKEIEDLFKEFKTAVAENEQDKVISLIDHNSINFLKALSDPKKLKYPLIYRSNKAEKLNFIAGFYWKNMKNLVAQKPNDVALVLFFFNIMNMSIFNKDNKIKILPNESKTGKNNSVLMTREINNKTLVSSRINFFKEGDSWKINLLDFLRFDEKILKQQFMKYKIVKRGKNQNDALNIEYDVNFGELKVTEANYLYFLDQYDLMNRKMMKFKYLKNFKE